MEWHNPLVRSVLSSGCNNLTMFCPDLFI